VSRVLATKQKRFVQILWLADRSKARLTSFTTMPPLNEYSITDTGLMLGLAYHRVRDLALRGVLAAQRDKRGRLMITANSIEDYRRHAMSRISLAPAANTLAAGQERQPGVEATAQETTSP
jgi:hypothetical protein